MDPVALELESGIGWIEFGDPEKRNLLTVPLLEALPRVLDEAVQKDARIIVLRGRGDLWSGGYDIEEIPQALFDAEPARVAGHPFERCMQAVLDCKVPTLAAIHGHAFGGALELAVSCDMRLLRAGSRLGLPAARLGLVYSHTGLAKFLRLLGPAHTRRLVLAGAPLDSGEAERIGLVNRTVEITEFDAAVRDLALQVASAAPLAVQGMKQVLQILERGVTESDIRAILALRQDAYRSGDFQEGRSAFREKREPRFRGRA